MLPEVVRPSRDPPLRDASGGILGVHGIFWDVTEQRKLEAQTRRTDRLESIGTLAGGVTMTGNSDPATCGRWWRRRRSPGFQSIRAPSFGLANCPRWTVDAFCGLRAEKTDEAQHPSEPRPQPVSW